MTTRRGFLTGISSVIAAPAIVRVSSLMRLPPPVRIVLLGEYDWDWRQKTPDEILKDINDMFLRLMQNTDPVPYSAAGFHLGGRCLMPPIKTITGQVVLK